MQETCSKTETKKDNPVELCSSNCFSHEQREITQVNQQPTKVKKLKPRLVVLNITSLIV